MNGIDQSGNEGRFGRGGNKEETSGFENPGAFQEGPFRIGQMFDHMRGEDHVKMSVFKRKTGGFDIDLGHIVTKVAAASHPLLPNLNAIPAALPGIKKVFHDTVAASHIKEPGFRSQHHFPPHNLGGASVALHKKFVFAESQDPSEGELRGSFVHGSWNAHPPTEPVIYNRPSAQAMRNGHFSANSSPGVPFDPSRNKMATCTARSFDSLPPWGAP